MNAKAQEAKEKREESKEIHVETLRRQGLREVGKFLRVKIIEANHFTRTIDIFEPHAAIEIEGRTYNVEQKNIYYDTYYEKLSKNTVTYPTIQFYYNCPESIPFIQKFDIAMKEYTSDLYSKHIWLTANMLTKCYKKPRPELQINDIMKIVGIGIAIMVVFFIISKYI